MRIAVVLLLVAGLASQAAAEEPPIGGPQKEHAWLEQLVGDWVTESEILSDAGDPPVACQGTMKARGLGGLWVVAEIENTVQGMPMNAVQTIGYDPVSKKYVGTWVDSVLNHLWQYKGKLDKSGKILTLEAEGPDMITPGKTAKYRDIYEVKSPDEIATRSQMLEEDGAWVTFGEGVAKRKK